MLFLREGEVCPLGSTCPHADNCWGVKTNRQTTFTCDFVREDGSIRENGYRNPMDKTGKMKIIMEDK